MSKIHGSSEEGDRGEHAHSQDEAPEAAEVAGEQAPASAPRRVEAVLDMNVEQFLGELTEEQGAQRIKEVLAEIGIDMDLSKTVGDPALPRLGYAALNAATGPGDEQFVVKYIGENSRSIYMPGLEFHKNLEKDADALAICTDNDISHLPKLIAQVSLNDGTVAAVVMERVDFSDKDTLFALSSAQPPSMKLLRPAVRSALEELAAQGLHLWDVQGGDIVVDKQGAIRFVDAGSFDGTPQSIPDALERLFEGRDRGSLAS